MRSYKHISCNNKELHVGDLVFRKFDTHKILCTVVHLERELACITVATAVGRFFINPKNLYVPEPEELI